MFTIKDFPGPAPDDNGEYLYRSDPYCGSKGITVLEQYNVDGSIIIVDNFTILLRTYISDIIRIPMIIKFANKKDYKSLHEFTIRNFCYQARDEPTIFENYTASLINTSYKLGRADKLSQFKDFLEQP